MAADWFAHTLGTDPDHLLAMYNYGVMQDFMNRKDEAEKAYLSVLAMDGNFLLALESLASLYFQQGRPQKALQLVKRALQQAPDAEKPNLILARLLHRAGNLAEAEACYDQVLRANPNNQTALLFKGNLTSLRGSTGESIGLYQRLLELSPGNLEAHYNLGRALHTVGREDQALEHYRVALDHYCRAPLEELSPADREISEHSIGCATIRFNYGVVLKRLKHIQAWLDNYRELEKINPDALAVRQMGLSVARQNGDYPRESELLGALVSHKYRSPDLEYLDLLLSNMLYYDVKQEDELRLYRAFDRLMTRRVGLNPLGRPTRAGDGQPQRIRVGYVSADLRRHVMGRMMLEILPRHDRTRFETYAYSLNPHEDEVTQALSGACDKFVRLGGLSARAAAERIAEDGLDILVDLQTHTRMAKAEILAYKPARIQITHIASCGALGLSAVDYKLTDAYADTEDNQQYLIEKLLRMDGCVYPYPKMTYPQGKGYGREEFGVPAEAILIGAFVSTNKLSPRCMALWKRVLDALPEARLVFSPLSDVEQASYIKIAAAAGIPESRFMFVPQRGGEVENMQRYSIIDFVLDTLPYGSVNGAFEPLSMGIPIVTLLGKRHGERTVYSILTNLGVDATVARSEDEFVEIAGKLAYDTAFRAAVRARIEAGIAHSALVDMDAHVRSLEAAYLKALGSGTSDARHA
ncbi:MAG: tetratricopeptide repeat protein [Hydrogenophilales bacterium]|nr:tetratricopeptide repeat protein [Hydrogenophilales bacterium]